MSEDAEIWKAALAATDVKGAESVDFRTLDISRDPLTQGFGTSDMETYDVLIVNNVLHVAMSSSLEQTLTNIRKLLKPGGAFVMAERTDLTRQRKLTPAEWNQVLSNCSLSELEPATTSWDAAYHFTVSTALALTAGVKAMLPVQVIPDAGGKLDVFASQISRELANHSLGHPSICSSGWPQGPVDPKSIYIILDEGSSPLLLDPSPARFAEIKDLALKAKFILWVSMRADGLNSASEADMQMATGFARVVRKENEGLKLVSLVVHQDLSDSAEVLHAVIRILKISFHEERDQMCELEYQYRDGKILVPRLRPASHYQRWMQGRTASQGGRAMTEATNFFTPDRPLKMEMEVPGLLSSMRFTDDDEHRTTLGDFEVEVQARAYGVNKGVELALGHANHQGGNPRWVSEWSGTITTVGSGLQDKWKVGDKVSGLGDGITCGSFSSHPRIRGHNLDLMRRLPSAMTFTEAAAALNPLTTAYHALADLTRLAAGQTVLIHAAHEATGQAAVMIARLLGAEVFATVRDAAGRILLNETFQVPETHIYSSQSSNYRQGILRQTGGRGVDVVMNFDGAGSEDPWACLALFGTFLDIVEGGSGFIMPHNDRKNARFISLDPGLLIRHRPTVVSEAMDKVVELIERGKLDAIRPTKCMPIGKIEDAFRLVSKRQTPGKVVLEINDGDLVKATVPRPAELELPSDATYVVPGGLGSLGERICIWLAERGAKHIVALTRSGSTRYSDAIAALERNCERFGAKLYRPACDITDEARVREVAAWCAANLPPVRGIIQSAAFFVDKTLDNMDVELFKPGGVRPKRVGTLNIYNAFASDKLKAFILLSSAATVLGSKGQAHYNAGNSFQEGFALQKLAEQKGSETKSHFTSIQPALISGSDADVTGAHRRKMFNRQGGIMVEFSEVLSLIEYATGAEARRDGYVQLVLGVDPNVIPNDGTYNLRFMTDILQPETGNSSADLAGGGAYRLGGTASVGQRLSAAAGDPEQMRNVVVEALAAKIRELIAISGDDLRPNLPLIELGVDSLVAIEIKSWIGREFGTSLQTSQVLDAPSIIELAENVIQIYQLANTKGHDHGDLANGTATPDEVIKNNDGPKSNKAQMIDLNNHGFACCAASKKLPVMPLLDLDTVLDLFYKAIDHLMTPEDKSHMVDQLNKLKEPGGLGRKLHARLMDRYNDPTIDNWLFEPANEQVYTGRNYPISPWSSFAGTDAFSKFPHTQAERAAIVSLSALEFKHKLQAGALEATVIGGRPQCMYQHGWLFNAFREPVVGVDKVRKMPDEDYIAVLRRGHLFRVDLVDAQGTPIPLAKLQATFQAIIDKVEHEDHSWIRQTAKDLHPENEQYLDMVEGAAFLVCLDAGSPTNTEERMERMLLNNGFNRWFDKGLKLIVCSNGVSGSHMEHSMIDGMTIRELYDARTEAIEGYQRSSERLLSNSAEVGSGIQLREYTFHTSPAIEDRIAHIRVRYLEETSAVGFATWTCDLFSQEYFQSLRLPAKGIYETMVQLGSKYFYHGKNYPCWSAISMGHYHKGRIDIVQTYTVEVQSFCRVVEDPAVAEQTKRALLVDAARSHGPNILRVQQGKGYERTLVALETQLREGETMPEIYSDLVYQSIRPHWVMSGSTDIGRAGGGEFGFILRHPDSIWLQYLVEPDRARFAIVMRRTELRGFWSAWKE